MRKIELETSIEEMDEADLRETFSDVLEAHDENVAEFAELTQKTEKAGEYKERVEELEGDLEEASGYFAQKASEMNGLSEDILVDRFSIDELVEMASEADEQSFSEEVVEEDEPEDDDDDSIFAERKQKSPDFSADKDRTEKSKERLSRIGGITFE